MEQGRLIIVHQTFSKLIDQDPKKHCQYAMRANDKIFVRLKAGVVIHPADGSYIRFIANSWYDGVDPESL